LEIQEEFDPKSSITLMIAASKGRLRVEFDLHCVADATGMSQFEPWQLTIMSLLSVKPALTLSSCGKIPFIIPYVITLQAAAIGVKHWASNLEIEDIVP
jgi:hypothetical protein